MSSLTLSARAGVGARAGIGHMRNATKPLTSVASLARPLSAPAGLLKVSSSRKMTCKAKSGSSTDDNLTGSMKNLKKAAKEARKKDKKKNKKGKRDYDYEKEMDKLQIELVKLQEWIRTKGLKVVIIFEGRDAAGKGGVIKRITEPLNPRVCYVRALGTPSSREKSQWYYQRYAAHLPAAGEMVLFDRSWYNRAGVERVMGFCTQEEYEEFLRSTPEFERMLVRSGITVIKYWFSVSDSEQEKRFTERLNRPWKRWKLSPMDLQARSKWVEYSKAKDMMFKYTDHKQAPWYVIPADDKKAARLNCISHLLSMIPYEDLTPPPLELPPRQRNDGYLRSPMEAQDIVPQVFKPPTKQGREDSVDDSMDYH